MVRLKREERSQQIWVFRFMAILSVCCAHVPMNTEFSQTDYFMNQILGMFGTLGVGGFFLCSGYYFSGKNARTLSYWKRKILKLITPWLLLGGATRIWVNIISANRPLLQGYWSWILGQGTWMYFIPVLIELMVIFAIFQKQHSIYVIAALSLLSNVITICGLGYGKIITTYMNPFNWAIFFALGLLWQYQEEKVLQIYEKHKKCMVSMVFVVFTVTVLLYFRLNISAYYWTWLSLPFELSGILLLLTVADKARNCKLFQDIGKNTLFIFMTHMIIAGGIMNHMPSTGIVAFMRPIVTLLVTYLGTLILRKLLVLCHMKWMIPALGMCEL